MRKFSDIVSQYPVLHQIGDPHTCVAGICQDSRLVAKNYIYVAIQGTQSDGHDYIEQAIEKGASVIICEKLPDSIREQVLYVQVESSARAAGKLASLWYQEPSHTLQVVGITGTNGKTTCATLLYQLYTQLGYRVGLISTVENCIAGSVLPSSHTTPDAISLQNLLSQMVAAGCTHAFMEVSSHAIHQQRIAGTNFRIAAFTNITHDHLDYHKTFDEYIRVKKSFFDHLPKTASALINLDDKRGLVMIQNTAARTFTYSLRTLADFKGRILDNSLLGLQMMVNDQDVTFRMMGEFNAYNLLCVYGMAMLLGEDKQEVLRALSMLPGAAGRLETFRSPIQHITGIVDYAHTPDALLNVLATLNKLRQGKQSLISVLGCGGNRDTQKRPLMALVACEHSDKVIFTSDNPRSEDPADIIQEMVKGVPMHHQKKFLCVTDRREAIKVACSMAQQGDLVLIAGKGHETYQEIKGVRYPFDDRQVLQEQFQLLEK